VVPGWRGAILIMKDSSEINESPEKQITKPPERKMETFDDLKNSDKNTRIETFDDIKKEAGSQRSIETFDDIAKPKEGATPQEIGANPEKGAFDKDTPEAIEHNRMNQAAEDIKKIDSMKPEKWETLSNNEKYRALSFSGEALRDAYNTPDPPLFPEEHRSEKLGEYGDGYSSDPADPSNIEKYVGSDYGIKMNKDGVNERDKKLFGDDPRAALETYGHEFRHSYQAEQAHAFDGGIITDDKVKAQEWSENMKEYKQPPDTELAKNDPDKYFGEYEAYRNQPVERDAREFSEKIVSKVYENNYKAKG